ncbi:MAG: undecaprenyl-phosphate glucose phosphotransferase [Planctomycetota bacterium]
MVPKPPILSSRRWADVVAPALDTASIVASLALVKWVTRGHVDQAALLMSLVAAVTFLLIGKMTPLGRRSDIGSENHEMTSLLLTWTMTLLVLGVIGFLTRGSDLFARSNIIAWVILAPTLIGLGRMCLRILHHALLRKGIGVREVAIAGLNPLGEQTAENIDGDPALGLNWIGFYDDRECLRDDVREESLGRYIGSLKDLIVDAKSGKVDTVLVTLPMRAETRIRMLLDGLSDSTASVYIVPDFYVFELLHSRWTQLGGLPAVSVFENPLFGIDGVLKRVCDVIIAGTALVLGAVPMLAIAAAVKLSSPGPVFFRQKRYGLDGREILVWKFRSMRTCDNGPVVKQASKGDPRITRVGAILRKTSLDELPQLFNVIEGSMSLVGPRPHASAHNEQYRSLIHGYMLRHKIKPGITGLAQVNGCRGETETIEKMQARVHWDHRYIRSWSLWLDLKILLKTLWVAWRQDEAY